MKNDNIIFKQLKKIKVKKEYREDFARAMDLIDQALAKKKPAT